MKNKTIIHHPLFLPLISAFMLRIIFMFTSHHIYYPDEIFQSLEQSHRLIHGIGLKPWDVLYGLRSFVFPLFLTIPLKLTDLLHITSPEISRLFPQTILILLSLSIPAAGFFLTRHFTTKTHAAQFTAITLSVWYELIYMSSRALTESVSVDCFAIAIIFLFRKHSKPALAAIFLTIGLLLRPQFFPVALVLCLPLIQRKHYLALISSTTIVVLLFGAVDWFYTGTFLSHLFRNLTLSFNSGISTLFGTQPWYFYLITLTISSAGMWLAVFFIPQKSKVSILQYVYIAILIIHSGIAHKEYRFVYILVPLWIILLSIFLHHQFTRLPTPKMKLAWQYATIIFCLISLVGIFHRLPQESRVYGQPILFTDPIFALYNRLATEPIQCGVFDTTRNWVYTPGYYGINQQSPLYSLDYPPPGTAAADYYIIPKTLIVPTGFTQIMSTNPYQVFSKGKSITIPGSMILKRIEPCTPNPQYTTNRSFPAVDSILQSIHAQPVIH